MIHNDALDVDGIPAQEDLDDAVFTVLASGKASSLQQAIDIVQIIEQRRRYIQTQLFENEKDWRFSPHDGGDPAQVSDFALQRELAIEQLARQHVARPSQHKRRGIAGAARARAEYRQQLSKEKYSLKFFPILFVSAPHIEDEVSGTFPGLPTPLLYATAVLDRYLRIDEFPSFKVPDVVAVMNPATYNEAFLQQLRYYVQTFHPRVVGISNLSEGHYFALQIARQIKALSPQTIIILGGSHEDGTNPEVYRKAAARAQGALPATIRGVPVPHRELYDLTEAQLQRMERLRTLTTEEERQLIDFVAAGDGPYLLMELMRIIADNLEAPADDLKRIVSAHRDRFACAAGSGYLFFYDRQRETIESIGLSGRPIDRNKLPFMFLGRLIQENRYPVFDYKKTAQVMACVGCKYKCSFCYESADQVLYEVPKLQQRTAENVIKELELLRDQGYEAVFFDDSTFTQNPLMIDRLLHLMIERKTVCGGYFEWGCQTTINDVNPRMLHKMAAAGCTYIYFGLESVEPRSDSVHKANQLHVITNDSSWAERFKRVACWCKEVGIRMGTSLQFGLHESHEQREQTIDLVAELYAEGYIAKNSVALNINTAYPGTDQWLELMKQEACALPDYRAQLVRHPGFETAHQFAVLTRKDADEIYDLAVQKLGDAIVGIPCTDRALTPPTSSRELSDAIRA